MSRATFHRLRNAKHGPPRPRPKPPRALSEAERENVVEVICQPRFADKSILEIYAILLDEGVYLCSPRTMYRILRANKQVRERRNMLRHPKYSRPELLAKGPRQLWSWDVTKLKGEYGAYFSLYVMLDVYSRYVVGWMVAPTENAANSGTFISEICDREKITPKSLVIHSDRGAAMTSKTVRNLLVKLGVTKSHSRPRVSNDNPYSESHFKTLKYHPAFPDRFGSLEDAETFLESFFDWYNNDHRHSGIALMTPAVVHHGLARECHALRSAVKRAHFRRFPERFVKGRPKVAKVPSKVYINPPEKKPPALVVRMPSPVVAFL